MAIIAVESPTLATKMWSCLKIMVVAVVPAVLRSPVLLRFQVAAFKKKKLSTMFIIVGSISRCSIEYKIDS